MQQCYDIYIIEPNLHVQNIYINASVVKVVVYFLEVDIWWSSGL